MSGSLAHSPARIIRQLLVDLGYATDSGDWIGYYTHMPDVPDSAICVYHTEGKEGGRTVSDGERQEMYGIQIRIRTLDPEGIKAEQIKIGLDQDVYRDTVVIETATYLVQAITRMGNVLPLGPENPTSRRRLFTINATVSLNQVS